MFIYDIFQLYDYYNHHHFLKKNIILEKTLWARRDGAVRDRGEAESWFSAAPQSRTPPGVVVCMNSRLVDGELYLIYTGGAALMRAGLSLYKKVRR